MKMICDLPKSVRGTEEITQAANEIISCLPDPKTYYDDIIGAVKKYMIFDREHDIAVCTNCGNVIPFNNIYMKHELDGHCNNCGEETIYLNGRVGRRIREKSFRLLALSKNKGIIYLAVILVDVDFDRCFEFDLYEPEIKMQYQAIYKLAKNDCRAYQLCCSWLSGYAWRQIKNIKICAPPGMSYFISRYNDERSVISEGVLNQNFFEDTDLKYADIKSFVENWPSYDNGYYHRSYFYPLVKYIDIFLKYSSTEILMKSGFEKVVYYRCVGEPVGRAVNWRGKSLQKIIGMDMGHVRMMRELDPQPHELGIFRNYYKKYGIELTMTEIDELRNNSNYYAEAGVFKDLESNYGITLGKVILYLRGENARIKIGLRPDEVRVDLRSYFDYAKMCIVAGYDLTVKSVAFPKPFWAAHDRVTEIIQEIREAKKVAEERKSAKAFMENQKKIFKTFDPYVSGDLVVMIPTSAADLRREGETLGICVGNGLYAGNIVKGVSGIAFVRKSNVPGKAFYVLEISPKYKLLQLRGKHNRNGPEEIISFVENWLSELKTKKQKAA